jgi:hypothetical protein
MNFNFDLNYFRSNINELTVTLNQALDFLNDYLHDASILFIETNGLCYSALIFIGKTIRSFEIDFKVFILKNFDAIINKLMFYLYEIRHELKFEIRVNPSNAEHGKTLHVLRMFALSYILFIANQIFRNSEKFCLKFVEKLGLKPYLLFLSDENFIEKCKNVEINDLNNYRINFLDYLTLNLNCLRYTCDTYKQIWVDMDVMNILLKVSPLKETMKITTYTTLAYILTETQVENLKELSSILNIIFEFLMQARADFILNNFKRCKVNMEIRGIEFDNGLIHCVIKSDKSIVVGFRALLESLKRFSVNDRIKCEIYFQRDLKSFFKIFLTKGKKKIRVFKIVFPLTYSS